MDEYTAMLEIRRRYPDTVFRSAGDVRQGEQFSSSFLAIHTPRTWLKRGSFHIHRIRVDGLLGQRLEILEFEEARHVNAR